MSTSITGLFVVSWSHSQSGFHIESIQDMVGTNMRSFVRKKKSDYIPIGIYRSRKQASDAVRELKKAEQAATANDAQRDR